MRFRRFGALAWALLVVAVCGAQAIPVTGDVGGTHDPSIIKDGGTWYVFATGKAPGGGQIAVRCSDDLEHWRQCGQVFDAIPAWIQQRSPATKDLWAPDISRMGNEFRLYYCYSIFGKNTSGIALAVNKTLDPGSPDYKWVDKGMVLESMAADDFNAIDPNFVRDGKGGAWLAFGSFWDGIKMRRLDEAGMVSDKDRKLYPLARRAQTGGGLFGLGKVVRETSAIEAPFLVRHAQYFYLFTSWDKCCRGAASTYRTMVGRSKKITGDYKDESGKKLLKGGGTELLAGNSRWKGPGGESVLPDAEGGDLMVFHAYDAVTGRPSLQVSRIRWVDDWPQVALSP